MQVHLSREQEAWLRAQVAAGRFSTLDEAVAQAIDILKNEEDDLAWAKPHVGEGLAELDAGQGIPADEVFGRLEDRLRGRL